jgi:sodium/hydrogen antiporter
MHTLEIVLALVGFLTIALGLASKKLERTVVPLSLLALLFGVAVGPAGLGFIDLDAIGGRTAVLETAARLTLAIGLIGVALRVPKSFPRTQWRRIAVVTGLGMLLMWAVTTLLVLLFLDVPVVVAALIAAIVTPTDPIAANPIATGPLAHQNLPDRLRHTISFDSGANDGLTFLFVFLPLLMLTLPGEEVASTFLQQTVLWQVLGAVIVGIAIGLASGWLLEKADEHDLIEEEWRLPYAAAVSLLTVGVGRLMGSDELLLVFAAGVAFVQVVTSEERTGEEIGQEAINRFFAFPMFALLGAAIPWAGWAALGWTGVGLAVAVLLLRRPLPLLLVRPLLGELRPVRDALFIGWFGPLGVAAIYYAALVESRFEMPLLWPVVSLIVSASIAAHGISSTPLTRLYGRVSGRVTERGPAAPPAR